MNIWDILIILLIALAVFLSVRTLLSKKNRGCSGYCAACPHRCEEIRERKRC